jgi:hypothetical protein
MNPPNALKRADVVRCLGLGDEGLVAHPSMDERFGSQGFDEIDLAGDSSVSSL